MSPRFWRFLALCLSLLAIPSATRAAAPEARCYEMRIYTAGPGKLNDLHARFRNHTMRLFEKHGMTNIGYWVPMENPEQKLIYILSYPSREARDESWKNFRSDPVWQGIKAASDANGPLAKAVEERFLQVTDFSPEVKPGTGSARRLFELRTYVASTENLERLINRARANTEWLFKTYDITYLGIWTYLPGQPKTEDALIYLLAHPSAEAGEQAFKKLRADPDWMKIKEASEGEAGGSLTKAQDGIVSLYLTPTDYSPLK